MIGYNEIKIGCFILKIPIWVYSQMLMDGQLKHVYEELGKIDEMALKDLEKYLAESKKSYKELQKELTALQKERSELPTDIDSMTRQIELSKQTVEIAQKMGGLKEKVRELSELLVDHVKVIKWKVKETNE